MAALHALCPAGIDCTTVARTVSDVPQYRLRVGSEFGPAVIGGRPLDVHLAAFDDHRTRFEPLFITIARNAGGHGLDVADAGAIPPDMGEMVGFGPAVRNDPTLDDRMMALFDHMVAPEERDIRLNPGNPGDLTGSSFDAETEALALF